MSGSFHKPGVTWLFARCRARNGRPAPPRRATERRGFALSALLLLAIGAGCGENVLVGSLQLSSLSDAGPDEDEAVEVDTLEVDTIEIDAGLGRQARNAERARAHAGEKSEQEDGQNSEQDGDHDGRSEDKSH